MTTVFHLKSRWKSTLKYNITILICPWPSSCWSPLSWWTSTFDIARFTSAKYVTLIMKSLDRWKITKTLKMRTNKPVVAPKRLPQNGGEVLHRLSAHQERWDPGRSTGRSAAHRSPPQWTTEQVSHTHLHEENFQCRSGCWGDHPPELRAPLRSRRASITYIDEIIMMTKVWQSCLTFWKCSTRPPKVKNKFYVSKTHYFKCLSTVST